MRYIDSGSRDPAQAVGTWLKETLHDDSLVSLRLQTGYVGPEPLGYLEYSLSRLAARDGLTSILLGSNGGETKRETVEILLRLAGAPRDNLHIGIAAFADGLFHPKVYHVTRADRSMAAYVGSANFTYSGLSGRNIEAGITLDTRQGDNPTVLAEIAGAVDSWFRAGRPAIFNIDSTIDIDRLASDGTLGIAATSAGHRGVDRAGRRRPVLQTLRQLVRLPAIATPMAPLTTAAVSTPLDQPSSDAVAPYSLLESWSKSLSASDAQRKPDGNQSGVVALTQGNRRGSIDQTTYFRHDLFGELVWQQAATRTGGLMDAAHAPMHVTILGDYLGIHLFEVTDDHLRESNQRNYTAKLSLKSIRRLFEEVDMTKRVLTLARDVDGDYWLSIE